MAAPPNIMSCLSWNCRGLGNPQTEDELVALVTTKDPKIVFLMETKVENFVLDRIGRRIHFANLFLSLVSIQVGVLLCSGSLMWMLVFRPHLNVTLMSLLTKERMTPSGLRVSMVTLKLLAGKTPGIYLDLCLIGSICHGYAWVILMRFCLLMRNWGG